MPSAAPSRRTRGAGPRRSGAGGSARGRAARAWAPRRGPAASRPTARGGDRRAPAATSTRPGRALDTDAGVTSESSEASAPPRRVPAPDRRWVRRRRSRASRVTCPAHPPPWRPPPETRSARLGPPPQARPAIDRPPVPSRAWAPPAAPRDPCSSVPPPEHQCAVLPPEPERVREGRPKRPPRRHDGRQVEAAVPSGSTRGGSGARIPRQR